MQSLNIEFEKAVRLLAEHYPPSNGNSRKPALFHVIRVGVYLYEKNYSRDIIIAGLLHDAIEWAGMSEETIRQEFGDTVARIVCACTKNDSIRDPKEKIEELIKRCAENGQDSLIVKTADIIDSFKYYTSVKNENELLYCARNTDAIFKYKPAMFTDEIFDELKQYGGSHL